MSVSGLVNLNLTDSQTSSRRSLRTLELMPSSTTIRVEIAPKLPPSVEFCRVLAEHSERLTIVVASSWPLTVAAWVSAIDAAGPGVTSSA